MLIEFTECLKFVDINKPINGIIHLGAHELEEKKVYNDNRITKVLWIEAMEDKVYKYQSENDIYQLVVSDKSNEEVMFKVTNNGQSSSILDISTIGPKGVHVVSKKVLKTTRMDTFFQKQDISIKRYNFINLRLQGVELRALKGFGKLLHYIDYIYTAVNTKEVYVGCDLVSQMDEYLDTFGFVGVITKMTCCSWGDKFYVKK
jgi:hypothetical protein